MIALTQSWSSSHLRANSPGNAGPHARAVEAYGRLPLGFEANQGQMDKRVKFFSRGAGFGLYLTPTEAVLQLHRPKEIAAQRRALHPHSPAPEPTDVQSAVLRMRLLGAKAGAQVEGVDRLPGKSNYFIGHDPKRWRTDVVQFSKVLYRNVYRGIDLVYRGNQRQLEFDFEVHPGVDPRVIHLGFEGVESLRLDPSGDLVLAVQGGEVRQHRPYVYQTIRGMRKEIEGRYVIAPKDEVRFELADYDSSQTVVIDPIIGYSTYLGGSNSDYIQGIAVDSNGSAYVTGYTYSSDFPTTPGAYNTVRPYSPAVFVSKLNASGNGLVYSTYLGGRTKSNYGYGIAVDSAGSAYVTGYTEASDFPTTSSAPQRVLAGSRDAFVTKLSNSGSSLLYSTYLGGRGLDHGLSIAVDSAGNASVTGYTESTDFPVKNSVQPSRMGPYDVFVTKIDAAGTGLLFSTYLGGSSSDYGNRVAVDSTGNTYVTGYTSSNNFPTTPSVLQSTFSYGAHSFVSKLSPAGSVLYSTYVGGYTFSQAIAVDSAGNAYLTGYSIFSGYSTADAFQKTNAGRYDAFVAKLNPTASSLVYYSYLGGMAYDSGYGIAVDASGNAHVAGYTYSSDFPTASPIQSSLYGNLGVYASTNGAARWSLSNSGLPGGDVSSLAVDPYNAQIVYAGVDPSQAGIYKTTNGGISWGPAGTALAGLSISAVVISPNNPLTVYAAANCGGVYASTDGGNTWISRSTGLTDTCIRTLALAPSNPNMLYAGTYHNVFKTTDFGFSWSALDISSLPSSPSFLDILVDPANGKVVYLVEQNSGLYRSNDGGSTWTVINNGLPSSLYLYSAAMDPTDSNVLYASTSGGLYKTTNAGGLWSFVSYSYAAKLLIDRSNPLTLYAMWGSSVRKSTDGGTSWNDASAGTAGAHLLTFTISASDPSKLCAGVRVEPDAFIARVNPSGSKLLFSTYHGGSSSDNAYGIASDPSGNAYVAGTTISNDFPTVNPLQSSRGTDAFVTKIRFDAPTLDLQWRFKVEVNWRIPGGASGNGTAVPLTSDAGYFWFFGNTNVELLVKILDGRGVNGYFWVFYGSMTDVQYTLNVTDTLTGAVKTYQGQQGAQESGNDIQAFSDTAGAASSSSAERKAAREAEAFEAVVRGMSQEGTKAAVITAATDTALHLNGNRFKVEVAWSIPSGVNGQGVAIPLTTDSGYFWFFGNTNVELLVKVLDGRGVNGHFWFFWGALTDVQYTITVTDTQTGGAARTYQGVQGEQKSGNDIYAF